MLFARDYLADQTILRAPGAPEHPLVSVVLPTYRRCKTGQLQSAIDSVLRQTFQDLELIVVDDGSTDGSADLIQACQRRDARVIHVRHERNSGIHSVRLNEGLELARGEYLICQFDDDTWLPRALECLVSEKRKHSEPCVVVGKAEFTSAMKDGRWVLPAVDLNLVALYPQNRMANNAVLWSRDLTERYGMYDCHLGMRRLCDWDLWLRYMKHVPFIVVDEIVSRVTEANEGSLGLTIPQDLPLFYYLHGIPRDELLTPGRWREYEVDGLKIGAVELDKDFRYRLYEDQIVPYYLKFRHHFPQVEGFSPLWPAGAEPKTILVTKDAYDVCLEVTLRHYDAPAHPCSPYKLNFQPLPHVSPQWTAEADLLLLVRSVEDRAGHLLREALDRNVPVGLHLDDDLLTFSEFGRQFGYLAPGTPYYRNLERFLSQVDAVWTTTRPIAESVQRYNPRHLPHNNTVPAAWLPAAPRRREAGRLVRIGYAGSGYRIEEFELIWDALRRIAREHRDSVSFTFLGLDVSALPKLDAPVEQAPFTFSYLEYMDRLKHAELDILLTPLLDTPRPRLAKSAIKYLETAVAGAIGIFSDVPQYERLPEGLTCLKTKNTTAAWYQALNQALTMPPEQFDLMRQRCIAHVREEFCAEVQIHQHVAAARATEFHARTRAQRHRDGKPRAVYVFHSAHLAGAEVQMWRTLQLARRYGVEPVVALPRVCAGTEQGREWARRLATEGIALEFADYFCMDRPCSPQQYRSDAERASVIDVLERWKPVLVHSSTFVPTVGQVCGERRIPHVASIYAVEDDCSRACGPNDIVHCAVNHSDTIRYARRWSALMGSEPACSRGIVPEDVFAMGMRRELGDMGPEPSRLAKKALQVVVMGTLQPRKRQLEAIKALGRLLQEGLSAHLHVYGYTDLLAEYTRQCKECVEADGLQGDVTFHGFDGDVERVLQTTDVLLSCSTYESLPGAIKEAMAAGVLVVATPVGGIPELIVDGVSGILAGDTSTEALVQALRRALCLEPAERLRITRQARRVARRELHPDRAAADLFAMYNRALDLTGGEAQRPAPQRRVEIQAAPAQNGFSVHVGVLAAGRRVKSRLWYELQVTRPGWSGLAVCLASAHGPVSFGGRLKMSLFAAGSPYPLRTGQVSLSGIPDYGWAEFTFEPITHSRPSRFRVEFTLETDDPSTRANLCIIEAENFRTSLPRRAYHKYLRFGRGGRLAYRLQIRSVG